MKYVVSFILVMILNQCWIMPVSQRDECYTQKAHSGLNNACGYDLIPVLMIQGTGSNGSFYDALTIDLLYQCYRELEFEKKCQSKSPYIPVWPPTQ